MVVERKKDKVYHKSFCDIINYLDSGDCLVMNNSRVFPARIHGFRTDDFLGSSRPVEFLLCRNLSENPVDNVWEAMAKPARKVKIGGVFHFYKHGKQKISAEVIDVTPEGNRILKFSKTERFYDVLDEIGKMPIPPYIKTPLADNTRYQTVYAKNIGSCAAPTAGLHFTENLMEKIRAKGINICFLTLHVGLGTFKPVKTKNILDHKMHAEYYSISADTVKTINYARKQKNRIIAVGTTSCRALESTMRKYRDIVECSHNTDIFIYPGYKFKITDALITNFHLPESTLIMLVSAFAGRDKILNAYDLAVKKNYRFFSFGDAMLIF
jgi:S-adenosylmethionine:tRNA ribosyltransferase-isomerase